MGGPVIAGSVPLRHTDREGEVFSQLLLSFKRRQHHQTGFPTEPLNIWGRGQLEVIDDLHRKRLNLVECKPPANTGSHTTCKGQSTRKQISLEVNMP
jgi:hypothetical protein